LAETEHNGLVIALIKSEHLRNRAVKVVPRTSPSAVVGMESSV